MTVAELIAKLQEMPQDMRVVCHDGEYDDFWAIEAVQQLTYSDDTYVQISPFEIKQVDMRSVPHMSWNAYKNGDWQTGVLLTQETGEE